MFLKPSTQRMRRRRSRRGFTLVELMLVVIIITVLASLAAPVMIGQWRERHGRQAASQVSQIFTQARMRAMARGAAVRVEWRSTGFTTKEAIEGPLVTSAACASQPGLGCLSNNWDTPETVRTVETLDTVNTISVTGNSGDGTAITKLDICFSPLGRSFISFDGSTPVTPMVGTPTLDVQRLDKEGATFVARGMKRTIVILPNGMARLAL